MISDSFVNSAEFVGIAIGGFFFYFLKKGFENLKESKRVSKAINTNTQIFENLVTLRATLDCDRVKMFQFFNGDYYTTGQSTLKMHMTYCSVKAGVSFPEGFIYSEAVPVSRVSHILKPLIEEDSFSIYSSDMDNCEWQASDNLNGTVFSLFVRIGPPGSIHGVIVCSYTRMDEIKEYQIAFAKEIASVISALMGS